MLSQLYKERIDRWLPQSFITSIVTSGERECVRGYRIIRQNVAHLGRKQRYVS